MRGRWIKRTHGHQCTLPDGGRRTGPQSVWQCRCGRSWRLIRVWYSPSHVLKHSHWEQIDDE